MPRAYSYIRMSTKQQQEGDSERRQLDAAHAWALAKGVELDDRLRDIGVSAHRGKHRTRGALSGFLAKVRDGVIPADSILIVENIDRLSREPVMTAFDTFRDIIRSGITLVLLDIKWELDEAGLNRESWRINALISMMERAHSESAVKSKRGLDAFGEKRKKAMDGIAFTANGPAWLKLDLETRKWGLIPERVAIVREMFELAEKGMGSYKIAKAFNQRGIPTFGGSEAWQSSYVSKCLRNEGVVGTWQTHKTIGGKAVKAGDPIPNYFPAIIDKSLWLTVQRVTLPRNSPGAKGKHFTNLFTGIAQCAACGGPMHVFSVQKKNRNKFSYLICATKKRGLACTAERNFRLDLIEDAVLRTIDVELERVVTDQDAKANIRRIETGVGEAEYQLDFLTRERDTMGAALGQATADTMAFVMGLLNEKSAAIAALTPRIESLKAELSVAKRSRGDIAANLTRLRKSLAGASTDERYELRRRLSGLLKDFIGRLDCDPVHDEIRVQSGSSEYVFSGAGDLTGVRMPRPALTSHEITEWRDMTKVAVVEDGSRLRFPTVADAVLFKLAFAEAA